MTLPPLPDQTHFPGWAPILYFTAAQMQEYASAAVLAERAACAAMCDEHSNSLVTADDCAAAIRARGEL